MLDGKVAGSTGTALPQPAWTRRCGSICQSGYESSWRQRHESFDEGLSPISSDLTTSRLDLPDTKPASAVTTIGAAPTASEEALPAAAAVSSSWWNVGTYIAGAAEAVSSSVRYVAGVHGGLRDHARNHLRSVWLEEEGEPLTVLRQIEAAIMGAAARAKGTIR
jgi:hypothetical protein